MLSSCHKAAHQSMYLGSFMGEKTFSGTGDITDNIARNGFPSTDFVLKPQN